MIKGIIPILGNPQLTPGPNKKSQRGAAAPPAAHAATALPCVTAVASPTAAARERPRGQAAPRVQEEMKALELAT